MINAKNLPQTATLVIKPSIEFAIYAKNKKNYRIVRAKCEKPD